MMEIRIEIDESWRLTTPEKDSVITERYMGQAVYEYDHDSASDPDSDSDDHTMYYFKEGDCWTMEKPVQTLDQIPYVVAVIHWTV